MKEANYNHLKLDNFLSFRSDFAAPVKKVRKIDSLNKANGSSAELQKPTTLSHFGVISPTGINGTLDSAKECDDSSVVTPPMPSKNVRRSFSDITNTSTPHSVVSKLSKKKAVANKKKHLGSVSDVSGQISGSPTTPLSCLKNPDSCIVNENINASPVFSPPCSRLFEQDIDLTNHDNIEKSALIDELCEKDDDSMWDDEFLPEDDEVAGSEAYVNCNKEIIVLDGYVSLGPPTETCSKCHAIIWKEERVNKNVKKGMPKFSTCCSQGTIKFSNTPKLLDYLSELYSDPKRSAHFKQCIRLYNVMFQFTSMGAKVDHSLNSGKAPYVYRLNGQNHHVFGSLIPNEGEDPKFCQLYVYDTEHEVDNKMKWVKIDDGEALDVKIVEGLVKMLDESNQLVKKFRYARDHFKNDQ